MQQINLSKSVNPHLSKAVISDYKAGTGQETVYISTVCSVAHTSLGATPVMSLIIRKFPMFPVT